MGLFDGTVQNLSEQALNATWYKQQVISNNIANSDTPDFKAKTVDFKIVLKDEYRKSHPDRLNNNGALEVSVATTYETNTNQTLNGNNVDMEKEALALADAQYQYNALIDQMNNNYSMIRAAITK